MLDDPHSLDDETLAELREQFDQGQLVELALAIALFHGFSKIAVALGPPPEMPVMSSWWRSATQRRSVSSCCPTFTPKDAS